MKTTTRILLPLTAALAMILGTIAPSLACGHPTPPPTPPKPPTWVWTTPIAPTIVAATACGSTDTISLPNTTGIAYTEAINGDTATVTAAADNGYRLTSARNGWTGGNQSQTYTATLATTPACPTPPRHAVVKVHVIDRCSCKHDNVTITGSGFYVRSETQRGNTWTFRLIGNANTLIKAQHSSSYASAQTYVLHTTDKPCVCTVHHTCGHAKKHHHKKHHKHVAPVCGCKRTT